MRFESQHVRHREDVAKAMAELSAARRVQTLERRERLARRVRRGYVVGDDDGNAPSQARVASIGNSNASSTKRSCCNCSRVSFNCNQ